MKKLFGILAVMVMCSGCATFKVNSLYPNFAEKKQSLNKIYSFTDLQLFEDGFELGLFLNVENNKVVANAYDKKLSKLLDKKGYRLAESFQFVGLRDFDISDKLKIKSKSNLTIDDTPLYVDEDIDRSSSQVETLKLIFSELNEIGQKSDSQQPENYVNSVTKLNKNYDADAYLFCVSFGRHVGFTKQITQGVGTALATCGFGYAYQQGGHILKVYLVDARTGEIVWMHSGQAQSGFGSKSDQMMLVKQVVGMLPNK